MTFCQFYRTLLDLKHNHYIFAIVLALISFFDLKYSLPNSTVRFSLLLETAFSLYFALHLKQWRLWVLWPFAYHFCSNGQQWQNVNEEL